LIEADNTVLAHFTVENTPFGRVSARCNAKTLFPTGLFG